MATLCQHWVYWYNYVKKRVVKKLKVFFRLLIIGTCLAIVWYYTNIEEQSSILVTSVVPGEQFASSSDVLKVDASTFTRPTRGISIFIGKSEQEILYNFGIPSFVEPTIYQYDWWIYTEQGLMVGMRNGVVNQIYTNASTYNISPYEMNETLDSIYRKTVFEEEVVVNVDNQLYVLTMDEIDRQSRILVKYDDLYMQLYMDKKTNTLAGIRFLDGETLLLHQPYTIQFDGELVGAELQSTEASKIQQMVFLTNSFRTKNGYEPLVEDLLLREVENMSKKFSTHFDAVEVIHSWMNSDDERAQLFTGILLETSAFAN